jgi:hypothetical protein
MLGNTVKIGGVETNSLLKVILQQNPCTGQGSEYAQLVGKRRLPL